MTFGVISETKGLGTSLASSDLLSQAIQPYSGNELTSLGSTKHTEVSALPVKTQADTFCRYGNSQHLCCVLVLHGLGFGSSRGHEDGFCEKFLEAST